MQKSFEIVLNKFNKKIVVNVCKFTTNHANVCINTFEIMFLNNWRSRGEQIEQRMQQSEAYAPDRIIPIYSMRPP